MLIFKQKTWRHLWTKQDKTHQKSIHVSIGLFWTDVCQQTIVLKLLITAVHMRNKLLTDLAFRFWMFFDCSILKCTENNKSKILKSFSDLWYIVALFIVHLNLSLSKRTFCVQKKSSRPHVIFDTDVRVRCINPKCSCKRPKRREEKGLVMNLMRSHLIKLDRERFAKKEISFYDEGCSMWEITGYLSFNQQLMIHLNWF